MQCGPKCKWYAPLHHAEHTKVSWKSRINEPLSRGEHDQPPKGNTWTWQAQKSNKNEGGNFFFPFF